jgi:uncharacterized protein YidB (DUF937 family)
VFVVDDLVGWLIGRLADAGYKKLIALLRGSDQARALRPAVMAAVEATVGEISPADQEQADRVAVQINKAFGKRKPVPLPPGEPTLLEALQAGIAAQLSGRDNAGEPAVSLPGVPVSEVADKLTGHLVREIMIRGSQPGPLTPLADQLNHDLTHLQGQRIEGMLAQLRDEVRDALAPAGSYAGPVGWPLAEVTDPFALEVHRPVEPDVPQPGLPVLPVYVPREHDAALAEVVTAASAGAGGIAVLVGGSSTGKTRACWQALELLRGQEPGWRLWHPVDPQAALAGLPGVGPRTVVWLNEAQRYLGSPGDTGERVAAGLRTLLRDRARDPVLVLGTLWPVYWDSLTARTPGSEDTHAQARELLVGRDITVPDAFTAAQLRQLEGAGDPRLAQAAAGSRDGQVIQYLAGGPELLDRYHNAPPAARALIDAAMDAGRLSEGQALARAFLEAAAPGYLTDTEWDLLPGDWLEEGLAYTKKPAKGVRGPLAPIRPRPGPGVTGTPGEGPAWQLADYLDQHGRRARCGLIPPASFWAAAVSYADPADLDVLGKAAENRGLFRDAARLYKQASAHGDPMAGVDLVRLLHTLHPGDQRPADWAAAHASLDDSVDAFFLLDALDEVGASGQVTALLGRDPAAHASLDDPSGVAILLGVLRRAGASGQVTTLATRAAAHASLDNPYGVGSLLDVLRDAGASGQVTTLLDRNPAAHASLQDPHGVGHLLEKLRDAGASGQVTTLLDRDPAAHASLDDPRDVAELLRALREAGASGQVTTLATRAAAHASLDNLTGVEFLLHVLGEVGASGQVTALATRIAAHASLDDPSSVPFLLGVLRRVGASGQVTALATRAAAHASPDDPFGVGYLLRALRAAGASGQVTTLLDRNPAAHASLDDPFGVGFLLRELREAGASGQVTALLDRDPAAHASLDDPRGVGFLLRELREAGASGQVTALLDRDPAAHASLSLDDLGGVRYLLEELREAGDSAQAAELIERLPAAGLFQLFCEQEGREDQFRFGREADGCPAKRWAWTNLG